MIWLLFIDHNLQYIEIDDSFFLIACAVEYKHGYIVLVTYLAQFEDLHLFYYEKQYFKRLISFETEI